LFDGNGVPWRIDQTLPHPGDLRLHASAKEYVALAERFN